MSRSMESRVLHVNEADAVRDLAAILKRVQAGMEVVIERDAQPLAVIRAAVPPRRTISECIALAEAHEKETGNAPFCSVPHGIGGCLDGELDGGAIPGFLGLLPNKAGSPCPSSRRLWA
jgi:antitoxin (DNA-binding transcriptional repressor) of toxin-antitoxin stability system